MGSLASTRRSLQEEIVTSPFRLEQDIIIMRMIGAGELKTLVTPGGPFS